MALPAEKKETIFTYADYLTWDEDERIELIDGEAVMMAPPSTSHQLISGELFRQLANFLEGKKCLAIPAPFAVRLFEREGDTPSNVRTVVEPDISVICDRNKLDAHGCKGAPDMVIEILSPSNRRHDRLVKLDLYQRAGVREYWIVILLITSFLWCYQRFSGSLLSKLLSNCFSEKSAFSKCARK